MQTPVLTKKPLAAILFTSFLGSNVVKGFIVESPTKSAEELPEGTRTIVHYVPENPDIVSTLIKPGAALTDYKKDLEEDPTAYPFLVETLKKGLAKEEIDNVVFVDWANQTQLDKSGIILPYLKTEEDDKLIEGFLTSLENPYVMKRIPKPTYNQANPGKTFTLTDYKTSKGFTFEISLLHKDTSISTHLYIPSVVTDYDDFESIVQFFETEARKLLPNTSIRASFSNFESFGKEDIMEAVSVLHLHPDQKSLEFESRSYKTPITEIQEIDWDTQRYSIVDENGMGPILSYTPTEEHKELVSILKKLIGQ